MPFDPAPAGHAPIAAVDALLRIDGGFERAVLSVLFASRGTPALATTGKIGDDVPLHVAPPDPA